MGIKTLSLYEVPVEVRLAGAANAKKQIQLLMATPQLTDGQKKELQARLQWVKKWEKLDIEEVLPKPARSPQHHDVVVAESINVKEK